MAKKLFIQIPCGRKRTSVDEHFGRLFRVATPEIIDKIHHMVLADFRRKVYVIMEL